MHALQLMYMMYTYLIHFSAALEIKFIKLLVQSTSVTCKKAPKFSITTKHLSTRSAPVITCKRWNNFLYETDAKQTKAAALRIFRGKSL